MIEHSGSRGNRNSDTQCTCTQELHQDVTAMSSYRKERGGATCYLVRQERPVVGNWTGGKGCDAAKQGRWDGEEAGPQIEGLEGAQSFGMEAQRDCVAT